jgi:hypothetical protein
MKSRKNINKKIAKTKNNNKKMKIKLNKKKPSEDEV